MTTGPKRSIETLIERSSLGSAKARSARARVPLARGQEMARAAEQRAAHRRAREEDRRRRQG